MPPTEKRKQREVNTDKVFVAVEGAAIETAAGEVIVRDGMRLRGSHPAVRARPDLFVRDASTDEEIAERRRAPL